LFLLLPDFKESLDKSAFDSSLFSSRSIFFWCVKTISTAINIENMMSEVADALNIVITRMGNEMPASNELKDT